MYNKPIVVSNLSANQYWSMYEEKDEIYVQHFAEQAPPPSPSTPNSEL